MRLWTKLRRDPLPTVVLLVGFVIGITLSSLGLSGLVSEGSENTNAMPLNMARLAQFSSDKALSYADWLRILRLGGSGEYILQFPLRSRAGRAKIPAPVVVDALLLEGPLIWKPDVFPRGAKRLDWLSPHHDVLLPTSHASDASVAILWNERYSVAGYMNPSEFNFPLVSAAAIPRSALMRKSPILQVQLFSTAPDALLRRFSEMVPLQHEDISVSFDTPSVDANTSASTASGVMTGLGILTLVVSVVNLTNAGLFWVYSRKREISVRRLVGAKRWSIIRLVTIELLTICLVSSFISIGLDLLLAKTWQSLTGLGETNILVTWRLAFVIAVVTGLISAVIPVRLALRVSPAQALTR